MVDREAGGPKSALNEKHLCYLQHKGKEGHWRLRTNIPRRFWNSGSLETKMPENILYWKLWKL